MKNILIPLIIGIFALAAAKKDSITSPEQPVVVSSSHPEFEIRLASNPGSTGYIWFLKSYDPIIEPVSMHYEAPKTDLVGASGVSVWKFKVNSKAFTVPQVMDVHFIQHRQGQVELTRKAEFSVMTFPETHYTSRIREFMSNLFSSRNECS